MKLLFTEGIGASQTTTNAQDEKIPVYETKTAAENDLVNLEVGQIIATKDEGNELSNPVDVVQDGNMHAVTSNAVANAIGGKKIKFISGTYTITNSYITIDPQMTTENYLVMAQSLYNSGAPRGFDLTTQVISKNKLYVYVTKSDGTSFDNVQISLLLMIVY